VKIKVRVKCHGGVSAANFKAAAGWRCGVVVSGVRRLNEVNARRARLVLDG